MNPQNGSPKWQGIIHTQKRNIEKFPTSLFFKQDKGKHHGKKRKHEFCGFCGSNANAI